MPLLQDFTMREDQTEVLTFILTYGGARPRDISSVTSVALVLIPAGGTGTRVAITTAANPTKLAISAGTSGEVTWTPAAGDVTQANSPYLYYFIVNVTASIAEMYPNDRETYIRVLKK